MSVITKYSNGQFSWVDVMAQDLEEGRGFYQKLFGWEYRELVSHGGPVYGQFEFQGHPVAGIGQMSNEMKAQGIPPMWNSYINVDDIESTAQKAVDLGATITVPVMKVMESGWLAFFQDPTGGHVGLWQAGQHCGATLVNDPGAFCWNELATRDIEGAKDFFAKLFGWEYELNPSSPTAYYIIKNLGRMNGGLMQMDEKWGEMPPNWMVYFTVENIETSVKMLSQLGGKIHAPPFTIPIGSISVVSDPQGACFSLIQMNVQPD